MITALARADWYCNTVDKYCRKLKEILSELGGFGTTAMKVINGDADTSLGNMAFLKDIESTLKDFVYGGDGNGGLMGYMISLAIAISMIFFLISILQLVTEDRFTPEFLVKFFAKFVIAFCVIMWSPNLLKAIIEFGSAFANMAGDAATGLNREVAAEAFDVAGIEQLVKNHEAYYYKNVTWPGYPTADAVANGITQGAAPWNWREIRGLADVWNYFNKKLSFTGEIGPAIGLSMEMATLSIFHLVSLAITAIVLLIILTRIMELYVRGSFLPIAAALMSDDGWRGSAGRYFRKLMSLACQNAVILVVVNIFGTMASSAMGSIFVDSIVSQTGCTRAHATLADIAVCQACLNEIPAPIDLPIFKPMLICIIICVAGISMMFKANGIVDDIWGAR